LAVLGHAHRRRHPWEGFNFILAVPLRLRRAVPVLLPKAIEPVAHAVGRAKPVPLSDAVHSDAATDDD
jgi:hypothetical protein